ncbi:MAG: phosphotransferase, partial [Nonomuraea sp.]|nr:phosphotransferase [Nonomuraea sp.]
MIEIPEAFVRSTVEREGEPGAAWLTELPGIADELVGRWECVPDGEVMHGGVGIVIPVRRRAGGPAVLKVSFQTSTLAEVEDGDEVVTVAGRINRRLAIPAPPGLPRLREQADAWEEQLRRDAEELTHTPRRHVMDAAMATVRELGRVQPDLLLHGDLHAGNILRADREPWLAVDPKGYAVGSAGDQDGLIVGHGCVLRWGQTIGLPLTVDSGTSSRRSQC